VLIRFKYTLLAFIYIGTMRMAIDV